MNERDVELLSNASGHRLVAISGDRAWCSSCGISVVEGAAVDSWGWATSERMARPPPCSRVMRGHVFDHMSDAEFEACPLIVEGESKIVREHPSDPTLCWIRYKPTIYSFTSNRAAEVPGSDHLRMRATRIFVDVLRQAGVSHAYTTVGEKYILSKRVHEPPPIEVVVKAFHSGTSKHRYLGMGTTFKARANHPHFANVGFGPDDGYPGPIVRFDWRNPMWHPEKVLEEQAKRRKGMFTASMMASQFGVEDFHPEPLPKEVHRWPPDARKRVMLADEVLGEAQADWFIDVTEARKTARAVYGALNDFLGSRDVVLYDLCLFITSDGKTVFGEISQDCGRFRHFDLGSLDKDVWRAGGSSDTVLAKWAELLRVIS